MSGRWGSKSRRWGSKCGVRNGFRGAEAGVTGWEVEFGVWMGRGVGYGYPMGFQGR